MGGVHFDSQLVLAESAVAASVSESTAQMQSESLSRQAAESLRAREVAASISTSESESTLASDAGRMTSVVASPMTSASQSESTLRNESALTNEREQVATTGHVASVTQSLSPTTSGTSTQLTTNSLRPQGNSLSSQAVSGMTVPGQLAPVVSVSNLLRSADRLAASQGLVAA